jgi:hypothetical protein
MTESYPPKMKHIIGPDGSPLTIDDLPIPGATRWVIRRKAEVVAAVRGRLLSFEEACSRYMLTVDEFLAWQRSIDRHGGSPGCARRAPKISPKAQDRELALGLNSARGQEARLNTEGLLRPAIVSRPSMQVSSNSRPCPEAQPSPVHSRRF